MLNGTFNYKDYICCLECIGCQEEKEENGEMTRFFKSLFPEERKWILFIYIMCYLGSIFPLFASILLVLEIVSLITIIVSILIPLNLICKFPLVIIFEFLFFITNVCLNINLPKDETQNCIYKFKGQSLRKTITLTFFFEEINDDTNYLINTENCNIEKLKEIEIY